jgi:hypothetical protein
MALSLKEVLGVVEKSMLETCNFYAKEGNMMGATAIHDAYLVLKEKLEKEYETKTQSA